MSCFKKILPYKFLSRKQRVEISETGLKRSGILSVICCVSQTKIEKWYFLIGFYGYENYLEKENQWNGEKRVVELA